MVRADVAIGIGRDVNGVIAAQSFSDAFKLTRRTGCRYGRDCSGLPRSIHPDCLIGRRWTKIRADHPNACGSLRGHHVTQRPRNILLNRFYFELDFVITGSKQRIR